MKAQIKGLENPNPKQYGGMASRTAPIIVRAAESGETYEVTATTETPAMVVDWQRWEMVREILPMRYMEPVAQDKVPLLDSHSRTSVREDLLGSATGWTVEGNILKATIQVSSSEQEVATKIREGHLDSVSIGYTTDKTETVEIPRGAEVVIDGVTYRNDYDDEVPLLVRTRWKVRELSLVAIGADEAAKFRAALQQPFSSLPADPLVGVGRGSFNALNQEAIMGTTETTAGTPAQTTVTADHAALERQRVREIMAIGDEAKMGEETRKAIHEGMSVAEFQRAAISAMSKRAHQPIVMGNEFLSPSEMGRYSVFNAIRAAVDKDWTRAGFEREVSRHLEKSSGRTAQGFMMPMDIALGGSGGVGQRAMSATLGTQPADGGALVATDLRADMFIDMLRAKTVLGTAGAQFMPGLTGNVDIPRLVSGASFNWVAEAGTPTPSTPQVGKISLSPKTAVARVDITRRLLQQSTPAAEAVVRNDLQKQTMLTIDNAGLNGTGATNQPRGLINTTGVLTQTIATAGAPTWAEIVAMEGKVDQANALGNNLFYVCTPSVASTMKSTPKVAGAAVFVNEDNVVNGYSVLTTTQTTKIIFGDFSNVLIGMWGAMDIVPDDKALADSGGLVLRVFLDMDVGVRYPVGFCMNA